MTIDADQLRMLGWGDTLIGEVMRQADGLQAVDAAATEASRAAVASSTLFVNSTTFPVTASNVLLMSSSR